ncbi:RidA family protein [Sediminispirochaeta smaragdinae]|jgi:2-iminobutanoate/2-iminopropanoate deaminase|uniref:Endoribonuclease L-PSP n=1 Tax=Sediminispirochaeta smaragdinae (strain DSM 11293 / JCM 15392 / SEBR 4228) TaxID=573413 RepID=E1RCS3_SEDSS|nr:RidA family protein [Sediminispirochaeta smaragdinae]ADK80153.1 endoribonuclease L-PSP [Sediminispirochaeta smaragdinae DSM 11293]
MHKAINAPGAPAAVGPYSHAVRTGNLVFTSGQLGFDKDRGELAEGIEAQTRQSFENLISVLQAAGSGLDRVVKVMVFLNSMDDFAAMNGVYASYLSEPYPARSCVEVAKLPLGGLVEIEMVALVD